MGELVRRILEEHQGNYVSGQDISQRLGTSRAAVWKQVQSLRRRGFGIEGSPGTGYRLLDRPDVVEERDLFSRISSRSFWASFAYYPVTDSTNSRAVELAEKGSPHGTVVCADAQTAGRGRFGRRWESPPGMNLYASILLRPSFEPSAAPQLTLVTAVALAKAVEAVAGLDAKLKWPNDLYLGGRKSAGILAEMSADPDRLRHVVIGVGINVNAREEDFPGDLREKATSLRVESGKILRRADVLARFLDAFAGEYGRYAADGFGALLPDWNSRSLLTGKRVLLAHRGKEAWGSVEGLSGDGALLFRADGASRPEAVHGGEILRFER